MNNSGVVDPKQAAEVAQASGVKVYCIGAGTQGRAPMPYRDPFSGQGRLRMFDVDLDEDTLKSIAETTGGRYFRATDRESLGDVYAEIDQLERTKVTEFRYLQYHEHYRSALAAALLLIGCGVLCKVTLLRTLP